MSFSQSRYPRKLVIEGDTVVAITITQLVRSNEIMLWARQCEEEKDTLLNQLDLSDSIIRCQNIQLGTFKRLEQGYQQEVLMKDSIVGIQSKELIQVNKEIRKQKRIMAGGGTILGVIILIILL